nr:unnamed protein product [Callosobruchus analis]
MEQSASGFSRFLSNICDIGATRKRTTKIKRSVCWWNANISDLRQKCIRCRRKYTRSLKKLGPLESQIRWDEWKQAPKTLRNAIKATKKTSWKKLCDIIDCDIWGDGYKIVMRMMTGFPPRPNMMMEFMKEVVSYLFPIHPTVIFNCDLNDVSCDVVNDPIIFILKELHDACLNMKCGKAPGSGYILPEIIKLVAQEKPEYTLTIPTPTLKMIVGPGLSEKGMICSKLWTMWNLKEGFDSQRERF